MYVVSLYVYEESWLKYCLYMIYKNVSVKACVFEMIVCVIPVCGKSKYNCGITISVCVCRELSRDTCVFVCKICL